MSAPTARSLASFGILFGQALNLEPAFKKAKKNSGPTLAASLATVSSLDFSSIDSLSDFGLLSADSRTRLGDFMLKAFSLTSANGKWASQERESLFESFIPSNSSVSSSKSFSVQLLRLGSELHLPPHLLSQLPFSSSPPVSLFLVAGDDNEVIIPFFAGFILLWALRVHVRDSSVDKLYPSVGVSSDSPSVPSLSSSSVSVSGSPNLAP